MNAKDKVIYQSTLKHADVEETIDLLFYRPVGFRLALLGRRLGWTPNAITIASIFFGVGCGVLCYFDDWRINLLGIVLLVIADICDSADGQLARLTGQHSQLGRILDGASGDFWFASIYIAICLRLQAEWGVWVWLLAVVSGMCHARQCAMADYYRQWHLLWVKGKSGSELDNYAEVDTKYRKLRFADDPIQKVFLWFYRDYTRGQEMFSPWAQRLRRRSITTVGPSFVQESRALMPVCNLLTFNSRAITLFLSLMVGLPWFYWVVEVTVGNALVIFLICKHESLCKRMLATLR